MEEIKITIHEEPALTPITRANFYKSLEKKRYCLCIVADCHEYLHNALSIFANILNALILLSITASFGASLFYTPAVSAIAGVATVATAIKQYFQPIKVAQAHDTDYKTASDLINDIEYLLLKNSHNDENLRYVSDVYDERIKSFRKHETRIPIYIKKKFAKQRAMRYSTKLKTQPSVSRI